MFYSRIIALTGLIFFTLSILTSLKFRPFSKLMGGISRQHRTHHWFALITAFIISCHFLLEIGKEPDLFFPPAGLELTEISLAWLAVILIAIATLFAFQKTLYHRYWLWIHSLFFIVWILILYHSILFIHSNILDQIILLFCIFTGTASIFYHIASGIFADDWIIIKKTEISSKMMELELKAASDKIQHEKFQAGSIVYLRFHQKDFTRQWHPFSVASCQTSPNLHLIIKELGRDTSKVSSLETGTHVSLIGPYHEFETDAGRDQCWIAGGTGIAPFAGMMHCLDFRSYRKVRLVYFAKEDDEGLSRNEINRFHSFHKEFQWVKINVPPGKIPSIKELLIVLQELQDPQILVCGPHPFMRYIRSQLLKNDYNKKNIQTEEFTPW